MKEKSSLELFAIALYEGGYLQGNGDEINALLEQHKAMHKKEILDAYNNGQQIPPFEYAENYYILTFGGDK